MSNLTPKQMLAFTTDMAARLADMVTKAVFVGLPAEKVGGKVYGDGMTVLQIGAIHEYGASFTHPGGTSYTIGKDGKARFVSNNFTGPVHGRTKAHNITIPERSFLRTPFRLKKDEINAATAKEFEAVINGRRPVAAGLGRIGIVATNISKGAFVSGGYGSWPDITSETKRRKGSSQTLIDTGVLRSSISSVVRNAS